MSTRVTILEDTTGSFGKVLEGDTLVLEDAVAASLISDGDAELAEDQEEDSLPLPASLSFTPAAGSTNVCEVTIQVLDLDGEALAGVFQFDVWLSDATSGAGLTGTTASGTVTNKTSSGIVQDTYTAKKALRVQTLATGVFILQITDSAKTAFKVCGQVPGTGRTVVSDALITGNYG